MNMKATPASDMTPVPPDAVLICGIDDLIPDSGVCALLNGEQVALFWLPERTEGNQPGNTAAVYALSNHDPIGEANVLSRGIVGDINGEPVVASPLYKQHFSLRTGQCIEDANVRVPVFSVSVRDKLVFFTPSSGAPA